MATTRKRRSDRAAREAERLTRIGAALERVRASCDVAARVDADPVGVVHRFTRPLDRELVGLVAALIAFGNVKTIRAKLEDAMRRIGPAPHRAADDADALGARLAGWKHRVFIGDDLARLLVGARAVQRESGSLGARFAAELAARGTVREALAALADAIRAHGRLTSKTRRGPAHLLPDPRRASGSKRLFLYLRWMVRPADGVDLGLWSVPRPSCSAPSIPTFTSWRGTLASPAGATSRGPRPKRSPERSRGTTPPIRSNTTSRSATSACCRAAPRGAIRCGVRDVGSRTSAAIGRKIGALPHWQRPPFV